MSVSAISPAQQARVTELSQLTTQQLIDHILALEAIAASDSVSETTHSSLVSTTTSTTGTEAAALHLSRKHKRPHSEQSTSAKHEPATDHGGDAQPAVDESASSSPTASSTSPLPSPPSPVPPPPKHQRLSNQLHPTSIPPTARRPPPPPPPSFDYWSYPVRHIALRFLYLGTPFYGFSSQPSSTLPTVESQLFHALLAARLIASRASCHYQRCGRTDRGVHAGGQVVSLWLRSRLKARDDGSVPVGWVGEGKKQREKQREERRANGEVIHVRHLEDAMSSNDDDNDDAATTHHQQSSDDDEDDSKEAATAQSIAVESAEWEQSEFDYIAMINRHLPPTIRILSYHPVPLSFSARFSCHRRTYHYLFYRDELDIGRMRAAGALLCGKHDWRNFCTYDVTAVTHFIRRIHRVDILPEEQSTAPSTPPVAAGSSGGGGEVEEVVRRNVMWRVEVEGKGFLYHQVRCMVSILFAIGRHEEPVELITRLLDIGQTPYKPAYRMASEKGLILQHSQYSEVADAAAGWPTMARSTVNLMRCYTDLYQQQRQLTMEAAVVRHMAAAIHTSLLKLAQCGQAGQQRPSGLLSQLPFQLGDRVDKRWLGGGELLREANLQRSFAERVQNLTGKRRERRQRVERLREEWKRKEGELTDAGSGDGGEAVGDRTDVTDATLTSSNTNDDAVK